jgi:hypothetical protein
VKVKVKCVVSYSPWTNAIFWLVVYFSSLLVFMFGVILIYDAYTQEFDLIPTFYFLASFGVLLATAWMFWRRGLFVKRDFIDLISSLGGSVDGKSGLTQGKVDGVRIEASFGRYLRDGPPFPRWHGGHVRKRPCGDPECMLCDSRFVIKRMQRAKSGSESWYDVQEVVGGTWEGMRLRVRLERAISDALTVARRERAW